jgi:glycosyltransferase involved in cell wall biosynthesis
MAPFESDSIIHLIRNGSFADRGRSDVNHITGDIHYISLFLPGHKTILTIHDIYSARRGGWLNRFAIRILWYYLPAWKVRYITVISEWSRKELLSIVPFAHKKIRVIPNPVLIPDGPFRREFNKGKPKILIVGTKSNKNLEGMLEACRNVRCSLSILGALSEKQARLLEDYGLEYTNHFNIGYDRVVQLYKECDLLLFASFEEGFGLPILEAQAAGRAVITSNITAMPDTAGEGAFLVDPYDVESIRNGLKKMIEDDSYRAELIRKGLENLKRFDPERVAGMYMELYRGVAGEKQLKAQSK